MNNEIGKEESMSQIESEIHHDRITMEGAEVQEEIRVAVRAEGRFNNNLSENKRQEESEKRMRLIGQVSNTGFTLFRVGTC
jgi:sensor histidine kinase YesM